MHVTELSGPPDNALARRFEAFEALFDYPLGLAQRFRISHAPDPTAFFRAIGEAKTWIVEDGEVVIAALSAAIRTLVIDGRERRVAYIGDLKIHPGHRGRRVLYRLAEQAMPWLKVHADVAYGVVMDGTAVTPDRYSGALGIPGFEPVSNLHILRFTDLRTVETGPTGEGTLRSVMPPVGLGGDGAHGRVEDTRRAKRLILDNGEELLSAHLSDFVFRDSLAGREVIDQALNCASEHGFPAMFLALSPQDYDRLRPYLDGLSWSEARATVYATDPICARLPINSAEI